MISRKTPQSITGIETIYRSPGEKTSPQGLFYATFSLIFEGNPKKVPRTIAICTNGPVYGAKPERIEYFSVLFAGISGNSEKI
jgi:hypothetical protein